VSPWGAQRVAGLARLEQPRLLLPICIISFGAVSFAPLIVGFFHRNAPYRASSASFIETHAYRIGYPEGDDDMPDVLPPPRIRTGGDE
jgi:hypothetical protein